MTGEKARRVLRGLPTGHYPMADLRKMTVRQRLPKIEEEPSTAPTIYGDGDYDGVVICHPGDEP